MAIVGRQSEGTGPLAVSSAAEAAAAMAQPASTVQIEAFFRVNVDRPVDSVTLAEGVFALEAGGKSLLVNVRDLETVLSGGNVPTEGALVRSLLIYEIACNMRLHRANAEAIVSWFRTLVASDMPVAEAFTEALLNAVLAACVETYANASSGMASDVVQAGRFTEDALKGLAVSGMMGVFKKRERDARTKVIEVHQYALNETLNHFMVALAEARNTGHYQPAYAAQSRFFGISARVKATAYWKKRAATRGLELAAELAAASAGGTNLSTPTDLAAAVTAGMAAQAAAAATEAE